MNRDNLLHFYKYQGTGNDFIMIDDRANQFDIEANDLVKKLCDRRFGIGADGLILIREHDDQDFRMVYFNSDGHLSTLCGNGSRCTVKFASFLGIIKNQCTFMTSEGALSAKIEEEEVHLHMPDVAAADPSGNDWFIDTGSPHHVQFIEEIEGYDVFNRGRQIRNEVYGNEGANVNFVKPIEGDKIFVRTYERGVENETLSCGTGVTASALIYGQQSGENPIRVTTLGGDLKVSYKYKGNGTFTEVWLIGPAERVFEGKIDATNL